MIDDRTPGLRRARPRRTAPAADCRGVGLPGYVRAERNRRTIRRTGVMESLIPPLRRKLVEGTEVLRTGGGATLTARECNALVDLIDATRGIVPWICRPSDVREDEHDALGKARAELMNALGETRG